MRNRMRVAVRKRMGMMMKMRTRAAKRAWWTQTQTQRIRVKCGTMPGAQVMGVHFLVSHGTELWSWAGGSLLGDFGHISLAGLDKVPGLLQGVSSALWDTAAPQLWAPISSCALSLCCGSAGPWKLCFSHPSQPDCLPSASSRQFPGRPGGSDL